MLYRIIFFMGLSVTSANICAMNVKKDYVLAIKEPDSGVCCVVLPEHDRELPLLLPYARHNGLLNESLRDAFMKEKLFAASMIKENRLPAEISNLIMEKSYLLADRERNRKIEKKLAKKYGISYRELCYCTKAQKQLLLYCLKDAQRNDGILTIEGIDKKFSEVMLERFYSLPITMQEKLSIHNNGNSLYVRTDYAGPSLLNKTLGQDYRVRKKKVKSLAKCVGTTTAVALAIIATAVVIKTEMLFRIARLYPDLEFKLLVAFQQLGHLMVGSREGFAYTMIGGFGVGLSIITLICGVLGIFLGGITTIAGSNHYAEKHVLNSFRKTLPEIMRSRGFEKIIPKHEQYGMTL